MITGAITTSILHQKAEKRKVKDVTKAPSDIQIAIYRETLTDLEKYLDVGDLRKLTSKTLGFIRDDILEIINGIREMRSTMVPGKVNSLDGTLVQLRKARTNLQMAIGMFDVSGRLKETKSEKFFDQMDKARGFIEEALKWSKPK